MNYKIRVESEAESKEAQDLLFELGYFWNIKGREKDYLNIRGFTHLTTFDKYIGQGFGFVDHQEITLPELRDLVVLKRNSIDGAVLIWKRETLNDQVASAETARQSEKVLKEILEGGLPEFELNVEQDNVNSPNHYKKGNVECIDAIQSSMTHDAFCGYLKGNVQKYMWRYENKGGVESLKKAQWYLNKLIEVQNGNS